MSPGIQVRTYNMYSIPVYYMYCLVYIYHTLDFHVYSAVRQPAVFSNKCRAKRQFVRPKYTQRAYPLRDR